MPGADRIEMLRAANDNGLRIDRKPVFFEAGLRGAATGRVYKYTGTLVKRQRRTRRRDPPDRLVARPRKRLLRLLAFLGRHLLRAQLVRHFVDRAVEAERQLVAVVDPCARVEAD